MSAKACSTCVLICNYVNQGVTYNCYIHSMSCIYVEVNGSSAGSLFLEDVEPAYWKSLGENDSIVAVATKMALLKRLTSPYYIDKFNASQSTIKL